MGRCSDAFQLGDVAGRPNKRGFQGWTEGIMEASVQPVTLRYFILSLAWQKPRSSLVVTATGCKGTALAGRMALSCISLKRMPHTHSNPILRENWMKMPCQRGNPLKMHASNGLSRVTAFIVTALMHSQPPSRCTAGNLVVFSVITV